MRREISLLGSTGSIGRQTLDVAAACGMSVAALTANRSGALLEEQARRFRPELAAVMDPAAAADLRSGWPIPPSGWRPARRACWRRPPCPRADTVVTAVVGMVGLEPTLAAIRAGKRIALANKETLVCAGELVMDAGRGARGGDRPGGLGALGHLPVPPGLPGPGRGAAASSSPPPGVPSSAGPGRQLAGVTLAQALKHPNWSMGAKITVDSATLMNKGLEFIEAMRLYRMPPEKISIVVHRESIVHSLVEYCDNAVLAQLGAPDMRLPIQYALTWPERTPGPARASGPAELPQPHLPGPGL